MLVPLERFLLLLPTNVDLEQHIVLLKIILDSKLRNVNVFIYKLDLFLNENPKLIPLGYELVGVDLYFSDLFQFVLRIDDIFESKRGKKRVKLHPYTGKDVPPSKGKTCSSCP